jgi:hypothetical protein
LVSKIYRSEKGTRFVVAIYKHVCTGKGRKVNWKRKGREGKGGNKTRVDIGQKQKGIQC